MSDLISKAKAQFLYYWLFILKLVIGIIVTVAIGCVSNLTGTDWSTETPTQHFVAICVIIALVGDKVLALFDKTLAQVQQDVEDDKKQQPPNVAP